MRHINNKGLDILKEFEIGIIDKELEAAENGVRRIEDSLGLDLTANQFSALVCLAYDIGIKRVSNSRVIQALDNDNFEAAANHFLSYSYEKGVRLKSMLWRRELEQKLFLDPDPGEE